MSVFKVIDKLFLVLFTFPPLYFAFRFVKWYMNTETEEIKVPEEEFEGVQEA